MEPISAEQFLAWKNDPCTEAFMDKLYNEREDMKEALANNAYENDAEVKGRCRCLALILSLQYQDLLPSEFIVAPQENEEMEIYDAF